MKIDTNEHGSFLNHQQGVGYLLEFVEHSTSWWGRQTPIYRLILSHRSPMMFQQSSGIELMPPDCILTDKGTVKPIVAQLWIPKDRFLCPFIFHDSIYEAGGCWIRKPKHLWDWMELTRSEADALLRTMCICDPVPPGWWKPRIVWTGVRVGGGIGWKRNRIVVFKGATNPNEWDSSIPFPAQTPAQ